MRNPLGFHAMVTACVTLLAASPPAQLTQITAAQLLPDQQTLDFTAGTPGVIGGMAALFTAFGVNSAQLLGTWSPGGDVLSQCPNGNALCSVGNQLSIVAVGGPLDNPTTMPGFGFTLQTPVTQAGFLPVDECCFALLVEVYSGGSLVGTVTVGNVGNCVAMIFENAVPFDEVRFVATNSFGGWGLDNLVLAGFVGPSCTITAPAAGATVGGTTAIDFDADQVMSLPLEATLEFSTDAGATFALATVAGALANPALGIPVPAMLSFDWDTIADGAGTALAQAVTLRLTVDDGASTSTCSVAVTADNVVTCMLAFTGAAPIMGSGSFEVTPDSAVAPTADALLEHSTDGGATFAMSTAAPGSANPVPAIPSGTAGAFAWDSRADGIALAAPAAGVVMRATADDGSGTATCSVTVDVDNTSLCPAGCGDCNLNLTPAEITDALVAAQISAGLVAATPMQAACCDINASMAVDIIDALGIAQSSAGLPVALMCL